MCMKDVVGPFQSWMIGWVTIVGIGLICSTSALAEQEPDQPQWVERYKAQVNQTLSLRKDFNEAQAMLDALEKPIGTLDAIKSLISKEARKKSALQVEIIELETAMEMPDPDPDLDVRLEAVELALQNQHERLLKAAAQKEIAATYQFMESLVAASEAEFLASQDLSQKILAENLERDLNSDDVALLHRDLGLPSPSES